MSLPRFSRAPLCARSSAVLFAVMLAVSACGGGAGGGSGGAAAPPVASVQAPAIATQPATQTVAVGQSATFTVAATGDGLAYQWQRNGADIAGATAASYVLGNAQLADDGSRFTVLVRNAGGSVTSAAAILQVRAGQLGLLAGTLGGVGQMDGPVGRFSYPSNVASSPSGELWVNDSFNQGTQLRKITQAPGAPATVTTLPYDGPSAKVIGAVDSAGNRYENWYTAIHKTTPAGVRTLLAGNPSVPGSADGAGTGAGFKAISGMAVDAGGTLYVADRANATIRKVSPGGVVTTLAGSAGLTGTQDGTGAAARFRKPGALALDKVGNVYVVDDVTVLRKITPAGVVTTLATVPRWVSSSGYPWIAEPHPGLPVVGGVAVGADGSVYVLSGNIRRVGPDGAVTNFAGDPFTWGAEATMAQDAAGNMYVVDRNKPVVFRVTPDGEIGVAAGLPANDESKDGVGASARIRYATDLYADAQGEVTFAGGDELRRITAGGAVSTLPGPGGSEQLFHVTYSLSGLVYGKSLLAYWNGTLWRADSQGNTTGVVASVTNSGYRDGPKAVASMYNPSNFLADPKGNVYFLERVWENIPGLTTQPSHMYVRRISPDGAISTLPGSDHQIRRWIADKDGNILFANDTGVQRMTPDGAVSTLYARPADLEPEAFNGPLALDRSGNLYIAGGNVLRKITPAGTVSVVAGTPGSVGVRLGVLPASLNGVSALAVGDDGVIYLQSENAILTLRQ